MADHEGKRNLKTGRLFNKKNNCNQLENFDTLILDFFLIVFTKTAQFRGENKKEVKEEIIKSC